MPGYARELYCNQYFHIMHRSNNRIELFKDDEDYNTYLRFVRYYFNKARLQCFHYVLMNTHLHFVVKTADRIKDVPSSIKNMHLKYTFYYKKKYGYEGGLWRNRYKAELIDNDRYMLGCGLYIEHNPVKAGMVNKPEDYQWSSYGHWIGKKNDGLLSEHPLAVVKKYREIADDYMNVYVDYLKLVSASLDQPRKM